MKGLPHLHRHITGLIIEDEGGILVMREAPKARSRSGYAMLLMAVVFNGFVLVAVTVAQGWVPGKWQLEGFGPGWGLLPLTPIALIGLFFVWGAAWNWWGVVEWRASANRLEYCWGWRSSASRKKRVYTDGQLVVRRFDGEGGESWDLCVEGTRLMGGALFTSATVPASELRAAGRLLAQRTGWKLRLPGDTLS